MATPLSYDSPPMKIAIAIALTALLVVDFWGLSLPDVSPAPELVMLVVMSAFVGLAVSYLAERYEEQLRVWGLAVFALVLVAAVIARFVFSVGGLPVSLELSLIVAIWAMVVGELRWSKANSTGA